MILDTLMIPFSFVTFTLALIFWLTVQHVYMRMDEKSKQIT